MTGEEIMPLLVAGFIALASVGSAAAAPLGTYSHDTANGILPAASCPPALIKSEALPAGLMRVALLSPCRRTQTVRFVYAGFEFQRRFAEAGDLDMRLDCFAGDSAAVDVIFEDGSQVALAVAALDLHRVAKIAVLWEAPVNLDLHAFEYAARLDAPGHVWAGVPSSAEEAEARTAETGRGHGFISSVSDGSRAGRQLEVYTVWRDGRLKSGVISLALDYESRWRQPQTPETCGDGRYSEIRYQTFVFDRNGSIKRQTGVLAALNCGVQLSGAARYNTKTLPEIASKP